MLEHMRYERREPLAVRPAARAQWHHFYELTFRMDAFTLPKALTRRLDRVARDTGAAAETLVRDAVKGHLDYLEWLGPSLEEAEKEAQETGWLDTDNVRRALAAEASSRTRGSNRSR